MELVQRTLNSLQQSLRCRESWEDLCCSGQWCFFWRPSFFWLLPSGFGKICVVHVERDPLVLFSSQQKNPHNELNYWRRWDSWQRHQRMKGFKEHCTRRLCIFCVNGLVGSGFNLVLLALLPSSTTLLESIILPGAKRFKSGLSLPGSTAVRRSDPSFLLCRPQSSATDGLCRLAAALVSCTSCFLEESLW